MQGRTWLITGCSTGFGRVLAELLLARGERVIATARRPETLDALVGPYGERALALRLDVTREADVADAIAAAQARFGAIDVLVNNAGAGVLGTVEETPLEVARTMMETNYFGPLALIRAVVAGMRERRSGRIVNIGSVAGQIGFPALAYYSASKFALAGMTESLAAELAPFGIHVTLAELGPFATAFTGNMTFQMPGSGYDLAALSGAAGNNDWGDGDDPRAGAAALLAALDDPAPPRRLLLGGLGMETVRLHDTRRADERAKWLETSELRMPA